MCGLDYPLYQTCLNRAAPFLLQLRAYFCCLILDMLHNYSMAEVTSPAVN